MERSLPLMLIIREVLGLAATAREARSIIKGRQVKVDGKICRDQKHGLGLFDIMEVAGKAYRTVPAKNGMKVIEVGKHETAMKVCQVTRKVAVKGGKIQLGLHDGRSILATKSDAKPGDSLLIDLPSQSIKEKLSLEPGALAMITYGANAGKLARIRTIERGLYPRVWLMLDNSTFEAPLAAVMPVGKEKSVITIA